MSSEVTTQLIPPSMGYGQVMDASCNMHMGYAPWVCGPYMQQPNGGNMHPSVSPYLMTVPASAQQGDQAGHGLEELAGEESPQAGHASGDMLMSGMDMNEAMTAMPALPVIDMGSTLNLNGVPPWGGFEDHDEEFLARQHNHYLRKGLRTPSSLGSPPLSAAPTEAPSPRIIEADSNQGSEYQDGSSDGQVHTIEATSDAVAHQSSIAQIQDMACFTKLLPAPMVEPYEMPLALQNGFAEAPYPASPSR
jgi:hypothetical protein